MDTSKIKKSIGQCQDREALKEVIQAAQTRMRELAERGRRQSEDAAWEAVKKAHKGEVLLVTRMPADTEHFFVLREPERRATPRIVRFAAGDTLTVEIVQPRARRIWARRADAQLVCLLPKHLVRIGAQVYPDLLRAQVAHASGWSVNGRAQQGAAV